MLVQTPKGELGSRAPDFALPDFRGSVVSYAECMGDNGLLVAFICNHCPYVKAIREKLARDTRELKALGIGSVGIMSNNVEDYPEDAPDQMLSVARRFGFPFPYLIDESQQVARAYGAVCTPDFFGYNADLALQYRGRLDAAGAKPDAPEEPRELFEAMSLVARTGQGPEHQTPSMGCSIKWKNG